jgi:hypothetical protein
VIRQRAVDAARGGKGPRAASGGEGRGFKKPLTIRDLPRLVRDITRARGMRVPYTFPPRGVGAGEGDRGRRGAMNAGDARGSAWTS